MHQRSVFKIFKYQYALNLLSSLTPNNKFTTWIRSPSVNLINQASTKHDSGTCLEESPIFSSQWHAETVSWWLPFIGENFCHIYYQVNKKISQKCFCRNKIIRPKILWRTWGDRWNWWQLRPTFFSETWNSHWPVAKNCATINCVSSQIDGSCCLKCVTGRRQLHVNEHGDFLHSLRPSTGEHWCTLQVHAPHNNKLMAGAGLTSTALRLIWAFCWTVSDKHH